MLDTNIISYIIRNRDYSLIDKFEEMSKEHIIAVSSITVAELFYGVMKKNSKKLEVAINEFLLPLQRLAFDENASYSYSLIITNLESKGLIIGSNDLFIAAAHAKSLDAVIVTNNTREFERIEDLKIEDWTIN
jgi:tRNA(fMet)-specific endonuclease VapC